MSTPLDEEKLKAIFNYHVFNYTNPRYKDMMIKTGVFTIANPNHGKKTVEIDKNITFYVDPIFTKKWDSWKVFNTIAYKSIMQEELSDKEAIDLLLLPDMNIDLPIKTLMTLIINFIANANIPDIFFKGDIINCEIKVLERFFDNDDLSEMIGMLFEKIENPRVACLIEKYGEGLHSVYEDGYIDGRDNNKSFFIKKGKLEDSRNLLDKGFDVVFISDVTGLSISEIEKIQS